MTDIRNEPCLCLIIYEKVSLKTPLEQRRFFNYLDDTCMELMALSKNKVCVNDDEEYKPADSLDDRINIRGIYIPAIVDNILYLAGLGDTYKSEFLRKAEEAKRTSDRKRTNNIMKRNGW